MSCLRLLASLLIALSSTLTHAQADSAPLASDDSTATVARRSVDDARAANDHEPISNARRRCPNDRGLYLLPRGNLRRQDQSSMNRKSLRVNAVRYLASWISTITRKPKPGLIGVANDGNETVRMKPPSRRRHSSRLPRHRCIERDGAGPTDGNPAESSNACARPLASVDAGLANGAPNEYVRPSPPYCRKRSRSQRRLPPGRRAQERQTAETVSATPRPSSTSKSLFPGCNRSPQRSAPAASIHVSVV